MLLNVIYGHNKEILRGDNWFTVTLTLKTTTSFKQREKILWHIVLDSGHYGPGYHPFIHNLNPSHHSDHIKSSQNTQLSVLVINILHDRDSQWYIRYECLGLVILKYSTMRMLSIAFKQILSVDFRNQVLNQIHTSIL